MRNYVRCYFSTSSFSVDVVVVVVSAVDDVAVKSCRFIQSMFNIVAVCILFNCLFQFVFVIELSSSSIAAFLSGTPILFLNWSSWQFIVGNTTVNSIEIKSCSGSAGQLLLQPLFCRCCCCNYYICAVIK